MRGLLRLNRFFRKYKGTVALGVVYLTASNGFLVWIPILIRQTLDELQIKGADAELAWYSLWLTLAALAYGVLLFLTRQTLIVTSRRIEYDLRDELYRHLQRLPMSWFAQRKSGDVYVRLTEDVNRVRDYFGPAFMYALNTVTRSGIVITMMFVVNAELTWWALAPLPILSVLAYWMSRYVHERSTEIQEQYAVLAGRAQETFSGIRLIKAYVREAYETARFQADGENYRKRKLRLDFVESLFHPTLNLLIGSSIVLVVWQGGELVMRGVLTVGNIAEFIIYVTYLTWPVAALGYTLNLLQRAAASNDRIREVMEAPAHQDPPDARMPAGPGILEFRNVGFRYPGSDAWAIRHIHLVIHPGEQVALIGRTGSGKTTLVQLIPRLFDPTEGEILLDGRDIRTIPIAELRARIGFVPQETFLFSDSIGENIAFGRSDADQAAIEAAAEHAQIKENILDFEKKFETILGERGITLSGGQKQRTAIARAIIRDPAILILDDSLSAVDTKTEDAIVRQLLRAEQPRSIITISHRISSIKKADRILVLQDGRLIEEGSHDELIRTNGAYATIYRKQLLEDELAVL